MHSTSLNKFGKTFEFRHDFNSSELDVLHNKFPHIKFQNIPEAWIVLLDKMLEKYYDDVVSVSQSYGFLITKLKPNTSDYVKKVISKYEKRLYEIDKDLHDALRLN